MMYETHLIQLITIKSLSKVYRILSMDSFAFKHFLFLFSLGNRMIFH
jgi:hypothetical protein